MRLAYYIGMNDDTILINGEPATDAIAVMLGVGLGLEDDAPKSDIEE